MTLNTLSYCHYQHTHTLFGSLGDSISLSTDNCGRVTFHNINSHRYNHLLSFSSPVARSLALMYTIPLVSMPNATSTLATPRGAGGMSTWQTAS